ncbi:MAG: hypothetical protein PVF66_04730 [Candidatus Aminicenantes bacterium]
MKANKKNMHLNRFFTERPFSSCTNITDTDEYINIHEGIRDAPNSLPFVQALPRFDSADS